MDIALLWITPTGTIFSVLLYYQNEVFTDSLEVYFSNLRLNTVILRVPMGIMLGLSGTCLLVSSSLLVGYIFINKYQMRNIRTSGNRRDRAAFIQIMAIIVW